MQQDCSVSKKVILSDVFFCIIINYNNYINGNTSVSEAYDPRMRTQPCRPCQIGDPGRTAGDQLRLTAHIGNGQASASRAGGAAFHLAAAGAAPANTGPYVDVAGRRVVAVVVTTPARVVRNCSRLRQTSFLFLEERCTQILFIKHYNLHCKPKKANNCRCIYFYRFIFCSQKLGSMG